MRKNKTHGQLPQKRSSKRDQSASETAWADQGAWYDERHGDDGDRHHREIIIPALIRHLRLGNKAKILDCCCGQGVVSRAFAQQGWHIIGVDASAPLIEAARERSSDEIEFHVGDAHHLTAVLPGEEIFDAACIILALQDLDPINDVLAGVAQLLKPGAKCCLVLTHPCFRIPRASNWHYDDKRGQQYRVLKKYLSPESLEIQTHPGARQKADIASAHFHRPLHDYINACGAVGLPIVASEELCSPRRGSDGKRALAEDRAAREFPMFLLLVAQKVS